MNTAHPQVSSSPHDPYRTTLPHPNDAIYRPVPPGAPPHPHSMPLPPFYGDAYAPPPSSRAPIPDQMQPADALAPLAPLTPGVPPAVSDPLPRSCIENGRKYELCVVQQPRRARMCGFGDKDRRPITPPPCVRLIITDVASGKEVDCNEIEHGMFVLNVDLWSQDGNREVNLVRHSATSPSISSTIPASFSEVTQGAAAYTSSLNAIRREPSNPQFKFEPGANQGPSYPGSAYNPYPGPPQVTAYAQPQGQPSYGDGQYHQGYAPPTNGGYAPNGYQAGGPAVPVYYGAGIHAQSQGGPTQYDGRPFTPNDPGIQRLPISQTQPSGMYTRNLIGSLAASAFRLTDPDDRIGIWFVLQDLSVRTEGHFRLRFSFVNVGATSNPDTPTSNSSGIQSSMINTGKAPVLAACFSEVFTVYSAKKFPGVVESTHLSKCFATQGIKIPIRKDGPGGKGNKDREEYDED